MQVTISIYFAVNTINFVFLFEMLFNVAEYHAAVGTIGVLQALETLKIILNLSDVISGRMLLFDATETKFTNVRLRPKNANCLVCGEHPVVYELIDYEEFCGAKANDKEPNLKLLKKEERITVEKYNQIAKDDSEPHVLIDVRSPEEYQICHLQNSINIPLTEIDKDHSLHQIRDGIKKVQENHSAVHCKYLRYYSFL